MYSFSRSGAARIKVARNGFTSKGITNMGIHNMRDSKGKVITNSPLVTLRFDDTRFAVVWLTMRFLLGWQWLQAGEKC